MLKDTEEKEFKKSFKKMVPKDSKKGHRLLSPEHTHALRNS